MEILLAIAGAGSAGGLLAYGSAANVRLMQVIRSASKAIKLIRQHKRY